MAEGYLRGRRVWLLALLVPLGLLLVVVAAWAMDGLLTDDEVARGVTVAGRDVSGLGREDLEAVLAGVASEAAQRPVTIATPEGDLETTAGDLGVTLDVEGTADAVMAAGREGPIIVRPWRWVGAVVGDREAAATYRINRAMVALGAADTISANTVEPAEPTIEPTDAGWRVVEGHAGEVLDGEMIATALATGVRSSDAPDEPIHLELSAEDRRPRFPDSDADDLAAEAERLTSSPLEVTAGGQTVQADPAVLRSFFEPVATEDALELRLREGKVGEWLTGTFGGLRREPVDATFTIGLGALVNPSQDGQACCKDGSARRMHEALDAGAGSVTLELKVLRPALTTADAEALGIVEPVASFTTNHGCCEPRVNNIHRIADLIRGAVIQPGETFSVNGYVGERTREKGFVEAGAIFNGSYVEDVGGGVSQFATTTFNAGFFAGLEFPEYQMHTIYISRYPYGREATISFPNPDLKIHNVSPYGILIWPTYTETSITVTLWSTRWVTADQTGQETSPVANGCTEVSTERTRTFLTEAEAERIRGGGPTEGTDPLQVRDSFHGVYQPGEGVLC